MTKRMLIDAAERDIMRVAIADGNKLQDLEIEVAARRPLKGNVYLAKVIRIEPSLQAAFVEYGGNRHGFLAFAEIHPDYYRIPVSDRERYGMDTPDSDSDEDDSTAPLPLPEASGLAPVDLSAPLPEDETAEEETTEEESAEESVQDSATASDDADADYNYNQRPENEPATALDADAQSLDGQTPDAQMTDGQTAEGQAEAAANYEQVGGDEIDDAAEQRRRKPSMRHYKIQEVIKRRQVMLIQVVKEERGNKGAALTTYLSLPGRYCVLMPNTERGGGVSRKINNVADRQRLKDMLDDLDIPTGMSLILRTAGMERSKAEIKRDLEYLLRLWDSIRDITLTSSAPALIYEEADLIKRAIRDMYTNDIAEVQVAGDAVYERAKNFMRMLMPGHARRVHHYRDTMVPLFFRYQVESQIEALHSATVQLPSGGYLVINPTEALVAVDVNSGKSTRERHIEETAYKTNLEAAEELARQIRLRDLAGLIVVDFIDMEDSRANANVERRLRDAMRHDRARLQIGRITPFGLLELSRQRLGPTIIETNFEKCGHCGGTGYARAPESAALAVLRALEEEGLKQKVSELIIHTPTKIAMYLFNHKRAAISLIEQRYGLNVVVHSDDTLAGQPFRLDRGRIKTAEERAARPSVDVDRLLAQVEQEVPMTDADANDELLAEPLSERTADITDVDTSYDNRRDRYGRNRNGRRSRGGRDSNRDNNRDNNRDSNRDGHNGGGRGNKFNRPPRDFANAPFPPVAGDEEQPAAAYGQMPHHQMAGSHGAAPRGLDIGDEDGPQPLLNYDPTVYDPNASQQPMLLHNSERRERGPRSDNRGEGRGEGRSRRGGRDRYGRGGRDRNKDAPRDGAPRDGANAEGRPQEGRPQRGPHRNGGHGRPQENGRPFENNRPQENLAAPAADINEDIGNRAPSFAPPAPRGNGAGAGTAAPRIRSVHELDTTPREDGDRPRHSSSAPSEIITENGDKPKSGWWKRITGGS